jgi:hypothetical protein
MNFDIPLPEGLRTKLAAPVCIPLPKPGKAQLSLPTGGSLAAIADVTKGIPDDCSMSFSLVLQLGPILANLDCLMKVVKVIDPLVKVVDKLSHGNVPGALDAMGALTLALKPLVDCIANFTGLGIFKFVRDILMLLAKILRCVCQQMRSILNVMSGIALQFESAQADGNEELMAALQCAQKNADTSMAHAMTAVEPVFVLLSLVEPFLGMANVQPIKTPQLASADSLEGLLKIIETLEELAKMMQTIAEGMGAE